jgi:3-hydroxyacyl-CoA dehydrogenase
MFKSVQVCGAGLMGSGIALVSAQAGFQVTLVDRDPVKLQAAKLKLKSQSITYSTTVLPVDGLFIEAIVEDLNVKRSLFQSLVLGPTAIVCSNTSSLSVADLAQSSTRFVGLHFFNPVPAMKLVELIHLNHTDPSVTALMVQFIKDIQKVPVLCKDTPGFIVNRLLVPYMAQACLLLERGDATIQDIDTAMKLGAGYSEFI